MRAGTRAWHSPLQGRWSYTDHLSSIELLILRAVLLRRGAGPSQVGLSATRLRFTHQTDRRTRALTRVAATESLT